jgi:hypothetical protein
MMILKLQHLFERDHEVTSLAFPARRYADPSRTWLRSGASRTDSVRNRGTGYPFVLSASFLDSPSAQRANPRRAVIFATEYQPEALQLQPCDWRDRCGVRSTQSLSES